MTEQTVSRTSSAGRIRLARPAVELRDGKTAAAGFGVDVRADEVSGDYRKRCRRRQSRR